MTILNNVVDNTNEYLYPLQVHGRARVRLITKEALLGCVQLGPEELVGATPSANTYVPEEDMDAYRTHFGLAIKKMAKIEMWHRLQL